MAAKTIDPRNKYARLLLELGSLNYEITSVRMHKTVSRIFIVEKRNILGLASEFKEQLKIRQLKSKGKITRGSFRFLKECIMTGKLFRKNALVVLHDLQIKFTEAAHRLTHAGI